ncbi:MAG: HlyD family efflux transporter periplasmic adaptor subunit [Curvibacter sp.]
MSIRWKNAAAAALVLAAALAALLSWAPWAEEEAGEGLVSGNGRIEATEIAIATKTGGRVAEIRVSEGDFVQAGQVLARMELDSLRAQREEAVARLQQAQEAVANARAAVALRESDHASALAVVAQRESELDAAQRRLPRSEKLAQDGFYSSQVLDDDRARVRTLEAALKAARSQAQAAKTGIAAAQTQVGGAQANVRALEATLQRLDVELAEGELKAPRDGRVQFRVAQPGEVIGAGARVLNLLDLSDVYMTFFLPETVAGRVAIGSEVRIVLDAAPDRVVPAKISFVASSAQFTPKTVETESERQKLMFRVRAQIPRELLLKYQAQVKTGLPGVAWVKLDPQAPWPERLDRQLVQ